MQLDPEYADLFDSVWRCRVLQMSPAAPTTRDGIAPDAYVCTAFTDPTVNSPLAFLGAVPSYKEFYARRLRTAAAAKASFRKLGKTEFVTGGGMIHMSQPMYCCTRLAEEPSTFAYKDLSFTFELFEHDSSRSRRESYNDDFQIDFQSWGESEHYEPYVDYLSHEVLQKFAGAPHFAGESDENLVWCSTVRPGPGLGLEVLAEAPCMNEGENARLCRRTSVGIDTGMHDYYAEWTIPYRLVVTATRDTDGKMCQIVDVRGREEHGFKELGGDSMTGGIEVPVVPFSSEMNYDESEDLTDQIKLGADVYFGVSTHAWIPGDLSFPRA